MSLLELRRVETCLACCCLAVALTAASTPGILALAEAPPAADAAGGDRRLRAGDRPAAGTSSCRPRRWCLSAYAIIWVAVLVYVALLWRRLGAVQKDLDALKHLPPR